MAAAAAPPRPKSPDPCGRHRLQLAVDALHREIGFLELSRVYVSALYGSNNELSSQQRILDEDDIELLVRFCIGTARLPLLLTLSLGVDEFVGRNPDPFIMIQPEKRSNEQSQQFLKKFSFRVTSVADCMSSDNAWSWQCARLRSTCLPWRDAAKMAQDFRTSGTPAPRSAARRWPALMSSRCSESFGRPERKALRCLRTAAVRAGHRVEQVAARLRRWRRWRGWRGAARS
ncbi:guanine nucleotide-binding protein subunit gamma 3-like isoform X2 [Panicum miliaceum]|uniref:Guanine nucleotide-binding protein subunit gamma 3-like isoform X2 n=1 Tax=Panicum miliaceum TaxID=4540 RepID=A0A3L6TKW5_PANMI|nr:guanine nucleotide-binding protein subunit gamma 3-like isoform X2 [Panicum miliaceum]